MNNINCTKEMIDVALRSKQNFSPLPWQKNAKLTGVGFDKSGQKVIEFVEYEDRDGSLQQSYHGSLTAYDNRVVNF
jgi:hypothetical protein